MKDLIRILVINTGSTSTKLSVFENETEILSKNLDHTAEELAPYANVMDQVSFRRNAVLDFLKENGIKDGDIDVIASRGGAFAVFHAGAYLIDENILALTASARPGFTPNGSWLAVPISYELAQKWGVKAYFYNAVFTDELCDIARYSGIASIKRRCGGHPLNTKEVCRRIAAQQDKTPEECTFIICHMGGGVGAELHKNGRIVDILTFTEGAFTPERAGRVPSNALIDLCFSGKFPDKKSMMRYMRGKSGMVEYLGTNSLVEAEKRIDSGDTEAENVIRAMAYQISKDIGSLAAAAQGKVDNVILTGGMAHSKRLTNWISENVEFIAPVIVVPGSFEMEALAAGIGRVYRGEEEYSVYENE